MQPRLGSVVPSLPSQARHRLSEALSAATATVCEAFVNGASRCLREGDAAAIKTFGFRPEKHSARHPKQGECAVNKLKQLEACGQSAWLDYLKRSLIEKGGCARSSNGTD